MDVFAIRHGETAWSLSGQHTGKTDIPLTDNGRKLAERLRPVLAKTAFGLVLSSPMQRARETCRLAGLAEKAIINDDLCEWNYGRYEGLTTEEINKTAPGWLLFRDGCPDGEMPEEVGARVDRVIARSRASACDVALFAHGHVLRVLAARWIGQPARGGEHFMLDTGTLCVLGYYREIPAVRIWNGPLQGLELRRAIAMADGNGGNSNGSFSDRDLGLLQFSTVLYYLHETNPDNGLVRDKTDPGAPSSIAAIGMALAAIPVIVERGVLFRDFAAKIARRRLRQLFELPQGPEPDASGHKGFFYHFLDIESGRRTWQCELSTIDSAFLFAGALTCGTYFDRDTSDEIEIRSFADALYRRADWNWARNGGATLTHGWYPESGFIAHTYQGYDEGLLLYILGLGSPTHPLPAESYDAYCANYQWKRIYGRELLHSGPLFTHQLSHMWIDFRGIRDAFMRERGTDYFENSRQATFIQQEYAIRNPHEFAGYGEHCWGFTACDGPGTVTREVDGVERNFFDYVARGAPFGPDDGTVAPWVVAASLPFAPEIVAPTLRHFAQMDLGLTKKYGFKPSFNQSFAVPDSPTGWWVTPYHFGIDQGPVVLMIENYRSGLLWNIMRRCPPLVTGLRRAGFKGGWL